MGKKGFFVGPAGQSSDTVQPKRRLKLNALDENKYFDINEIQDLFRVIKSKRDRAIFRLAYHRGLRAHEVGLLQLGDFRDKDGVLFVHRGKGSISREHSLTDEELRCLRAYLRDDRGTMPGPLFPSRQGRRGISRKRLDQLMKMYCKLAKLPPAKAHMHALKHSCGTHLAERGATGDEIQDWLGHRDISSTDIYLHFTARRRAEAAAKHRDWR